MAVPGGSKGFCPIFNMDKSSMLYIPTVTASEYSYMFYFDDALSGALTTTTSGGLATSMTITHRIPVYVGGSTIYIPVGTGF